MHISTPSMRVQNSSHMQAESCARFTIHNISIHHTQVQNCAWYTCYDTSIKAGEQAPDPCFCMLPSTHITCGARLLLLMYKMSLDICSLTCGKRLCHSFSFYPLAFASSQQGWRPRVPLKKLWHIWPLFNPQGAAAMTAFHRLWVLWSPFWLFSKSKP